MEYEETRQEHCYSAQKQRCLTSKKLSSPNPSLLAKRRQFPRLESSTAASTQARKFSSTLKNINGLVANCSYATSETKLNQNESFKHLKLLKDQSSHILEALDSFHEMESALVDCKMKDSINLETLLSDMKHERELEQHNFYS